MIIDFFIYVYTYNNCADNASSLLVAWPLSFQLEINDNAIVAYPMLMLSAYLDSKVHGAKMGPIWGRQDPGAPHVGPMNLAILVGTDIKSYKLTVKQCLKIPKKRRK